MAEKCTTSFDLDEALIASGLFNRGDHVKLISLTLGTGEEVMLTFVRYLTREQYVALGRAMASVAGEQDEKA